jgi:nicotinate-nucleotide adenylyltransferase
MQPAAANLPPTPRPGLGVLGGTFDPPHRSHERLARAALAQLPIGELLVIPAGDHPHKQGRGTSPASHRLAMCELAFAAVPGARIDDREVLRAGLSFTVDTLAELRQEHPGRPLYFLIGSDNLPLLPTWREHHRILALATVVTYPRAGHPMDASTLAGLDLDDAERQSLLAQRLPLPADAVSSTAIRAALARGEDCPDVAPGVAAYALRHRLYTR